MSNTGVLTTLNNLNLDGAFSQDGTGAVSLGGNITTTSDLISFNSGVTLTSDAALTGTTANFDSTLSGSAAQSLTVVGNSIFTGAVSGLTNIDTQGSAQNVGTVAIGGCSMRTL